MTPLERAEDAIFSTLEDDEGYPLSALTRSAGPETGFEGRCYIDGYVDLRAIVRAVLTAVRQPNEAMITAARDHLDDAHGREGAPRTTAK